MALTLGVRFQPTQNPAEIGEAAAECERAGFDAVWMTDTPLLAGRWGDPYVCLALIASRTERLKFGTAVTNPYVRHFPAVAGACASLHDLSGGRFILGLGAGASAARELGFPLGKLKQLRELTSALRRLFREGACEFDGRPKEFNPPRAVPVYIAAMGPKTIKFAGAEGDGVILQVGANRKTLTWAMNLLRTGAEKAGRDVSEIDVVVSAQCAVDQDRKAAIRRVRHLIGIYFYLAPHILKIASLPGERTPVNTSVYPDLTHALDLEEAARATEFIPDEVVESLGLIGSPDEWVSRLLMMEEVGVNHVQLRGPESFSLPVGEIAFCRDEVIPSLLKAQGGIQ